MWAGKYNTSLILRPCLLDKSGTASPEILGLLTQHYQKSGESIRLLILADHMIRMAAEFVSQLGFSVSVLWAYDYPNEVSSNARLQQSRHDTTNFH